MKNKITDLNDHLFAQLERLSDEDLNDSELEREIERSKAVTSVAEKIISNGKLALDATRLQVEYGSGSRNHIQMPEMLEMKEKPVQNNAKGKG